MSLIIRDLDNLIISFARISTLKNLILVNKSYADIVHKQPIFKQWRNLSRIEINNIGNIFCMACYMGYLEYAKYLYGNYTIFVRCNNDAAFIGSCVNGHLDIAKWLVGLNNCIKINTCSQFNEIEARFQYREMELSDFINTTRMNSRDIYFSLLSIKLNAFARCCQRGHLDVAKWLIQMSDSNDENKIDIHSDNEAAFRWSCKNGYMNVAKWLVELGESDGQHRIKIHARNDDAFRWSCKKGYFDIAKWLVGLSKLPAYGKIASKMVKMYAKRVNGTIHDEFIELLLDM